MMTFLRITKITHIMVSEYSDSAFRLSADNY